MRGAVFALTPGGCLLAHKVGERLGLEVFLPRSKVKPGDDATPYDLLSATVAECFGNGRPLVLIMATGIAVRILAPLLKSKLEDPPVVVMDEAGSYAISLLSGHWGGANDLALRLGEKTGALPVITTATDVRGLTAIDRLARELGALPEPFARVKSFSAALLAGEKCAVFSDDSRLSAKDWPGLSVFPLAELAEAGKAFRWRAIHSHFLLPAGAVPGDLYLRPCNLYAGVGCRRGTPAEKILLLIKEVLARFNLSASSLAALCSIEAKRDEAGLAAAAAELLVPVLYFDRQAIQELDAVYSSSALAEKHMGVRGVCEPTAILGAKGGTLLVPKQKRDGVTVAVAVSQS